MLRSSNYAVMDSLHWFIKIILLHFDKKKKLLYCITSFFFIITISTFNLASTSLRRKLISIS